MSFGERWSGNACWECGVKTGLLRIEYAYPPYRAPGFGWSYRPRARCLDRERCRARKEKKQDRSRLRGSMLVIKEAAFPDAPVGTCRWCGEILTGENGSRRNYCYPDREGRDCRGESDRSRAWSAQVALVYRGDPVCVDCGSDRPDWEADHEVPLEDGGEHSMENLVRRCSPCHSAKTAREARARAERRRPAPEPSAQLALG